MKRFAVIVTILLLLIGMTGTLSATGFEDEDVAGIVFLVILILGVAILAVLHSAEMKTSELVEQAQEEQRRLHEQVREEELGRVVHLRGLFQEKNSETLMEGLLELAGRLKQESYAGDRKEVAGEIYRLILGTLKNNPEFAVVALDFGRLCYGIGRPEDNPSVYDESAIMNDIAVHR